MNKRKINIDLKNKTITITKVTQNNYRDFNHKIYRDFNTRTESAFRKKLGELKSKINQFKYGGLIWFIAIYLLFIILGSGVLRVGHFVQYSGTLKSEEYDMKWFDYGSYINTHDETRTEHKYYQIKVEYEVDGKIYESNVRVSKPLYDDVVDDFMFDENPDMTPEEILGTLHYKPWNPKKISIYR